MGKAASTAERLNGLFKRGPALNVGEPPVVLMARRNEHGAHSSQGKRVDTAIVVGRANGRFTLTRINFHPMIADLARRELALELGRSRRRVLCTMDLKPWEGSSSIGPIANSKIPEKQLPRAVKVITVSQGRSSGRFDLSGSSPRRLAAAKEICNDLLSGQFQVVPPKEPEEDVTRGYF